MYEEPAGQLDIPGEAPPCPRLAVDRADEHFQERILEGVSRTFALTIPQLPPPLARVVANAYLLCRIADTIEDSAALTSDEKERFHEEFLRAVEGANDGEDLAAALPRSLSEDTLDAERELVAGCPRVLRITHSLPHQQRSSMVRCLTIMSRGMARFERLSSRSGLADVAEMERYCYVVAGVVGEMLTDIFCSYSSEIAQRREQLAGLSKRFGQGLQMTNILKDVWDDLEREACWLPRDVFEASGFDLGRLQPGISDPGYRSAMRRLVGIAHSRLRDALSYTLLIPRSETGIRRFLLWAIGLAVLTLRNIHSRPDFTATSEVKISRRSVMAVVGFTNTVVRSNLALKALYRIAARGLPVDSTGPEHQQSMHRPSLTRG